MKVGTRIGVGFVLGLVMILIVGAATYVGTQRVIEANRWVTHTHQVLEGLEDILSVLQDAETGQRGYIITGEERYLEPYNAATAHLGSDIDALAKLIQDNPAQHQKLGQMKRLADSKLEELRQTIELRREGGIQAATPVILTDRGKQIMDEIRAIVAEMEKRERDLLERRNAAADASARRTTAVVAFAIPLSLLALTIAAIVITRAARFGGPVAPSSTRSRSWGKTAIAYLFAVILVALASLLRWWLVRSFGPLPTFVMFYPAVLLAALLGGGGPGVLATVLSALAADYWFIPPFGFGIEAPNDILGLCIFSGFNLFLCVVMERLRRARWAEAVSAAQEQELDLLDMGNLASLDAERRIRHWSQGCTRFYGFTPEEAQGRTTDELLQTHYPQPLEEIRRVLLERGYWEGELIRRRKDGEEIVVAILWALRRDNAGNPSAILEVSSDLTQQKLAEEALAQQAEELSRQNEELAQQSEELAHQNEELQTQREEMEAQNEELQSQSEEIQALNSDLSRREKLLQGLLESARSLAGEREVMEGICRSAIEMLGEAADAVAVMEQEGDHLETRAYVGLGNGSTKPAACPMTNSFAAMVMQQNRTASLEDASLRPDLAIFHLPGNAPLASALGAPLRLKDKPIGIVGIYSRRPTPWTAEQFRLAEWVAAQCSLILDTVRAREALRESRQLLQAVVDNSQALIYVKDLEGRILIANQPLGEAVGMSVPEILGKTSREIISDAKMGEAHMANDRRIIETGQAITSEEASLGNVFLSVKFPLRDAQGRIIGTGGISTDITERKQAEQERQWSVEFLRIVNEAKGTAELVHAAASFFHDCSGCEAVGIRIREGNDYPYFESHGFPEEFLRMENSLCAKDAAGRPVCDSAGYPIQECMCGNVVRGRFDPAKPFFTARGSFWSNGTTELLASTSDADRQARTRNRCNGEGYESVALIALRIGNECLGLLQLNDKRKNRFTAQAIALWERLADHLAVALVKARVEEALHESQERLGLAMASARMATFDWDIVRNKRTWDSNVHRLLGTNPETFTGAAEEFFQIMHPDDRGAVQAALARALETTVYETEYRAIWPDGSIRHIAARGTVHRDGAGRPVRMTGICWDISERKQAEEALRENVDSLRRTAEDLARSNKDLEQFAYVASHDLQEPLRMVNNFMQLLHGRYHGKLDEKANEYIQFAMEGATRMQSLIDGLLDYSRIAARDKAFAAIDSTVALQAALANLKSPIEEAGVSVTHEALPTLEADRTQLMQVFQNLIGNAIKFRSPNRRSEIHIGARREKNEWIFSIKDNGIGIAPQFYERIFLIFQRLHPRHEYPGAGIGLSVCKRIMDRHHGRIWVESQPGHGSTFYFAMPDRAGLR